MTDTVRKNVPSDFPLLDQDILTGEIDAMRVNIAGMLRVYRDGSISEEQSVEDFLKVFLYAMNSGVAKGTEEGRRQVQAEVISKLEGIVK